MKFRLMGLLCAAALVAGCASAAVKDGPINPEAKNYAEALQSAATSCKVDADCTSVKKGCCLCNGYAPVNKDAAAALKPLWEKECSMAACTLQMCYVEINTSCQNGVCVGTPKPMEDYMAY